MTLKIRLIKQVNLQWYMIFQNVIEAGLTYVYTYVKM